MKISELAERAGVPAGVHRIIAAHPVRDIGYPLRRRNPLWDSPVSS